MALSTLVSPGKQLVLESNKALTCGRSRAYSAGRFQQIISLQKVLPRKNFTVPGRLQAS